MSEKQPPKLCHGAESVLKLSKGRRRIKLEDCGPAPWNRFGAELSGKHSQDIIDRIVKKDGLVVYRYGEGWAVEPNPDDPLEVYRHASKMSDPLLPVYEKKALFATFKCSHLAAGLLKSKQGNMPFVGSEAVIDPNKIQDDEWKTTMSDGIFFEVFSYADYIAHKNEFHALMASDNFDAGFSLAEDEVQLITRMQQVLGSIQITDGMSHFEAVKGEMEKFAGARWNDADLINFYNYAKTASPSVLEFTAIYQRFICDPTTFQVSSRFYSQLSTTPSNLQMLRLAMIVRQQTSDEDTECQTIHKFKVANAMKPQHWEFYKEIRKDWLLTLDGFAGSVFKKYWKELIDSGDACWRRKIVLAAIGTLFYQLGNVITGQKGKLDSDDALQATMVKLEQKIRMSLFAHGTLPTPIHEATANIDDLQKKKKKSPDAEAVVDHTPALSFDAQGKMIQNVIARARDADIRPGAIVRCRQLSKGIKKGSVSYPQ